MFHYSEKEIEELDRVAVADGLEIRQMMELAGFHMIALFDKENVFKESTVAIVCGKGNKGGDGLSAARHLVNHGWKHITVVLADTDLKPDGAHHLALLEKMQIPILVYGTEQKEARGAIAHAEVVIDALIGYHLDGAPRGAFAELIEIIEKSAARIISYDIPSGANPTTGVCAGACIQASATLTLAIPKKLLETETGRTMSGRVYVADIGIPQMFYDAVALGSRPDFSDEGIIRYA